MVRKFDLGLLGIWQAVDAREPCVSLSDELDCPTRGI